MIAQILLLSLAGMAYAGAPLLSAPVAVAHAEPIYPPQPYSFGYDTTDEFGTRRHRQETSNEANQRTGSYGYTDAAGIYRQVDYVADELGFRATVSTNEPGTAAGETAGALYNADPAVVAPVAAAPAIVKAHAPVVAAAPAYHAPVYAARPAIAAPVYAARPAVVAAAPAYHAPVYAARPALSGPAYSAATVTKVAATPVRAFY